MTRARGGLCTGSLCRAILAVCALLPLPVSAFEPEFSLPLRAFREEPPAFDSYALPTGPWAGGKLPVREVSGQVSRRVWQLQGREQTLYALVAPQREALAGAGWTILLDCEARACGGFDFRFNTEILPEPDMHVDLNHFRFLSAARADEALSLLVSRSGETTFVQQVLVAKSAAPLLGQGAGAGAPVSAPHSGQGSDAAGTEAGADAGGGLSAGLPVVLEDLVFDTGAARLSEGDYASLRALAAWLSEDPARRLILVGHTDLSGSLEANIALSRRRAAAVREALISKFQIAPARLEAEGVGPLAPRSDNGSEAGRQKNRRVEALPTTR